MHGPSPQREPSDWRRERARTERALAIAVVVFLVGVGSVAIALVYGPEALLLGSLCLASGAALFGLVWGILTLLERISN